MEQKFPNYSFTVRSWLEVPQLVLVTVIFCFSFVFPLPEAVAGNNFAECKECHVDSLSRDARLRYSHSPFREQQCEICHEAKYEIPTSQEHKDKKISGAGTGNQKITWLAESFMADTSHGFLLPQEKMGDTLVIELHDNDGMTARQEIAIPPLPGLTEIEDNSQLPTIFDIQVLEVKHGIFISATIGWQTDILTDATIQYSNSELSQASRSCDRLGRRHEVSLYQLQPNSTYQFTVISSDLFGHSQTSEPLTFSTAQPIKAESSTSSPAKTNETGIISSFHRFGTNYLFEMNMVKPASVMIGSKGTAGQHGIPGDVSCTTEYPYAARRKDNKNELTAEEMTLHSDLSSLDVISRSACQICHESRCTHPVNICPKPGMSVIPEYPLLQSGRITCVSCHAPHGSQFEFITRRFFKHPLCIGCHKDKIN